MPAPVVSVIIPVLDDAPRLARCLDALAGQVDAPPYEVVVVDNGSRDGSDALARRHPAGAAVGVVVVVAPGGGSYAARNAGIAVARGSSLAFTDADCVPAPDWVAAGSAALARDDVVAGPVEPLRSPEAGVWERYDSAVYLRQEQNVLHAGFGATANLWVRRSVLDAVGLFDAELRSSGDLDWGRRAAAAGHPAVLAPDVVVAHAPRTSALTTWRLHRRLGAGWAAVGDRHAGVSDALWLPVGQVIDAVAADGPPLRRRQLLHVHLLAMAARRTGWAGVAVKQALGWRGGRPVSR